MAFKSASRPGAGFDPAAVAKKQPGSGVLILHFEGPEAIVLPLKQEAGGHRYQRVPPTEKNGSRVHTSTVTVAVLAQSDALPSLREMDIRERITKGTGPGGQNRNRNAPSSDTQVRNSMDCAEYAYSNSYSWCRSTLVDTLPP